MVSISVVPDIDAPHETDTLWVMQYGQFVDHDLTSTPVFRMSTSLPVDKLWRTFQIDVTSSTGSNGGGIQCCTEQGLFFNDTEFRHPECFNIDIPEDDPFFSKFGQRCMSFIRSVPAPRSDCSFGHGEQVSSIEQTLKTQFNVDTLWFSWTKSHTCWTTRTFTVLTKTRPLLCAHSTVANSKSRLPRAITNSIYFHLRATLIWKWTVNYQRTLLEWSRRPRSNASKQAI